MEGKHKKAAVYISSRHCYGFCGGKNEAICKQKDGHGVILHSDQGFQYTSNEYKAICEANGIIISMSPKGSPVDNSPIESFHSNLKRETLHSYNITSLKHYVNLVKDWILFYNTNRIRLN